MFLRISIKSSEKGDSVLPPQLFFYDDQPPGVVAEGRMPRLGTSPLAQPENCDFNFENRRRLSFFFFSYSTLFHSHKSVAYFISTLSSPFL